MRKLFSFILLGLLCSIGNVWGVSPDVNISNFINDTTAYLKSYTSGTQTIALHNNTTSKMGFQAESNETAYYFKMESSQGNATGPSGLKISASTVIDSVSILITANSANKACNVGLIGWEAGEITFSNIVTDFAAVFPEVTATTKKIADAQWTTLDLSSQSLTTIVIAKQFKNVVVNGAAKADFPSTGAQSFFLYGVKVWLHSTGGGSDPQPGDPVDPTITFNNGAYTVGEAALDLSTLFTSNSAGAVTYTVKTDGGTGAVVNVTSFSASAAGTAVVTASQAAATGYNAKSVDANIVVSAAAPQPTAGDVIFSADVVATAKKSFTKQTTTEITASDATLVGGTMFAINNETSDKELIGKQSNYFMFCLTNNGTFFKVELDQALAEGDVISAKTYTRTDAALGLWISTATSRPNSCSSALTIDTATTAGYESLSDYTITSSDGLVGATTIYIYRHTGKSTYFNEFKVVRPAQKEIASTVITMDGVTVDGEAIAPADLANLQSAHEVTLTESFIAAPVVIFNEHKVITYTDESQKITDTPHEVTATEVAGLWQAQATINEIEYTLKANKQAATFHHVTYSWGVKTDIPDSILPTQADVAETLTFAAATPNSRVKYRFQGWNDGNATYASNAEYTMGTSDVTLTAQWAADVEQVSIADATTWDWTKSGSSEVKLESNSYPKKDSLIVLANIAGIDNDAEFNSAALMIKGEYAVRDGKYYQGSTIKFRPTVPGVLSIKYSSTGSKAANNRHLAVNDVLYGDDIQSTTAVTVSGIPVAANEDVEIKGVSAGEPGTADAQYLRFSLITFTPTKLDAADTDFYGLYYEHEVTIPSGISAYTGALNNDSSALVLTQVSGSVIPAETPVLVKANAADTYYFAPSNTGAEAILSSLKGVATATTVASIEAANSGKTCLTLGEDGEGVVAFRKPAGTSIAANKVYLLVNTPAANAPAIRIVMDENNATNIEDLKANEKAVKFFENGKLFILREGVVYDATGRMVR